MEKVVGMNWPTCAKWSESKGDWERKSWRNFISFCECYVVAVWPNRPLQLDRVHHPTTNEYDVPQSVSSLLSPQSSRPSHRIPDSIHHPLSQRNCCGWHSAVSTPHLLQRRIQVLKKWAATFPPFLSLSSHAFPVLSSSPLPACTPKIWLRGLGERCKPHQRVRAEPSDQTHIGTVTALGTGCVHISCSA